VGVLFLESSLDITGEILHIDGGRTAGHRGLRRGGLAVWPEPRQRGV
jgi:hypothetical protein